MLNQEQTDLVIEAIKDKRDFFADQINKEQAKSNSNRLIVRKLSKMYHEYDEILNEVQRVGV